MSASLKEALKSQAIALGLDAVGIAAAHPFEREGAYLEARQASHSGPNAFEEPNIEKRVNPSALLPGINSIIAVGVSYLMSDDETPAVDGNRGWLSRYCRGLDYHTFLEQRLEKLVAWLHLHLPGTQSQIYVDTGPPLDRAVAERAGVGKFGKSTMMITPKLGTWTFLGEVYTTAILEPDEPLSFNACGSCTRCIDACPTQCISDWQLDADRCLGYINQMDGVIPHEYREVMGNRLFGCDDCQDVCPYNQRALADLHSEFAPRPDVGTHPDLMDILSLSEPQFQRKFAPTAAAWRGLETLQRNALVALGNSAEIESFSAICALLNHPNSLLRIHAAWALTQLAHRERSLVEDTQARLTGRQLVETDQDVCSELATNLKSLQQLTRETS